MMKFHQTAPRVNWPAAPLDAAAVVAAAAPPRTRPTGPSRPAPASPPAAAAPPNCLEVALVLEDEGGKAVVLGVDMGGR